MVSFLFEKKRMDLYLLIYKVLLSLLLFYIKKLLYFYLLQKKNDKRL